MSTFYVSVQYQNKHLILHVPMSWSVGRMKELILLYHSESPAIRSQVLSYKGQVLENTDLLATIFNNDSRPELEMQIEAIQDIPDHLSGYKSELFKLREEEYIRKYDIAKQLLLDTHHKSQESSVIPEHSVLNSLPLLHPETNKRVKFLTHAEKPRKIRLRKVPFSIYFDFFTIFRWAFFVLIARMYLGTSIPMIYYVFILACYILNVRLKIERHREKELKKLPRDYLMKILPERYNVQRENTQKKGIFVVLYETFRGFFASLLPWFDPVAYANQRNIIVN